MAAQVAHLVDCILPAVPIRQFLLSFPFELSVLAATKPQVLRALARIHAEKPARHYKRAAKKSGEVGKLHAGAVTFVQRFGSSLNLHVHLHTCALDGVYVEGEDGHAPRFVPAPSPSRAELYVLTERVALRVMTWLRKRGHRKDDDHDRESSDTPERSFAEVLAQLATQRGTVENVKDDTGESEGPAEPAGPLVDEAVTRHGFNMHASITIAADDDLGRERLCRYGLRPPFSLSRLARLARRPHRLPGEEVVAARLALPHHDAARMHREALRARAAAALSAHALPWCAGAAREASASHRADAAQRVSRTRASALVRVEGGRVKVRRVRG
jgi:hypothetical protein